MSEITRQAAAYKHRVGTRITRCREELGISQATLSQRLGCSARTVGKWEAGEVVPRVGMQLALARIFGIAPNALMSFEHEPGDH